MGNILIIGISYGSSQCYQPFCTSFIDSGFQADDQILIVENKSDSVTAFSPEKTNIRLLKNKNNSGYLGGAHFALIESGIDLHHFDWVIICNIDVTVSNDFITKLKEVASALDENVVSIAPKIISDKHGHNQNPHYVSRPTAKTFYLKTLLMKHWILFSIYRFFVEVYRHAKGLSRKNQDSESKIIYSAHGSFFILKSDFLLHNIQLEQAPFLYAEEFFIAELIKNEQRDTIYIPDLTVTHLVKTSVKNLKESRRIKLMRTSSLHIYHTFFNT